MKKIMTTDYPELLRFIFSDLRYETSFPFRDNFMLVKNLTHQETYRLKQFQNYLIISTSYAEEHWGRQEVFDYVKSKVKSRRKPAFGTISDIDFEKNIKIFILCGDWVTVDIDSQLYKLYGCLNEQRRSLEELMRLLDMGISPIAIIYSLLTFAGKSLDVSNVIGASSKYYTLLKSYTHTFKRTLSPALTNMSRLTNCDDTLKVIRFVMDLGGSNYGAV